MLVKHINNNTFDIFFNQGWDNWGRFQIENNKLTQIGGITVPANIITYLTKRHCK